MAYTNVHESVIVKHGGAAALEPVSRTYQYRKVMKPMLERKRRARINRCLDELKELMVTTLQSEGENVSKLEKADILELTVRHLHKLRRQHRLSSTASPLLDTDRFRAGFTHAANEVSRCLAATPGVDINLGTKLMTHLGHRLNDLDKVQPLSIQVEATAAASSSSSSSTSEMYSPASSPAPSSVCSESAYTMPMTPSSSRSCHSGTPSPRPIDCSSSYTSSSSPSPVEGGLLKVVYHHHHHQHSESMMAESVWRPW